MSDQIQGGRQFAFLLVDKFSMFSLAAAIDTFRSANRLLGRDFYGWTTVSADGDSVMASNGLPLKIDYAVADLPPVDILFVSVGLTTEFPGKSKVLAALRSWGRRGGKLGALSVGSYLLAEAGQLDGYRCTIHWEDRDVLHERFPQLIVSNHLVEIDRDRYTCSGGVSPIDLMTLLLSRPPGSRQLAAQVSDLLVSLQRSPDERQTVPLRQRFSHVSAPLVDALEMMESNVEEPLKPDEIAGYLGVSRRTLERLFHRQLGVSPAHKYLEIRLERARLAMLRGSRGVDEVAQSVGFASLSHFIARYRQAFGKTPTADRAARRSPG